MNFDKLISIDPVDPLETPGPKMMLILSTILKICIYTIANVCYRLYCIYTCC